MAPRHWSWGASAVNRWVGIWAWIWVVFADHCISGKLRYVFFQVTRVAALVGGILQLSHEIIAACWWSEPDKNVNRLPLTRMRRRSCISEQIQRPRFRSGRFRRQVELENAIRVTFVIALTRWEYTYDRQPICLAGPEGVCQGAHRYSWRHLRKCHDWKMRAGDDLSAQVMYIPPY